MRNNWAAMEIGVVSLLFLIPVALTSVVVPSPSIGWNQTTPHVSVPWGAQSTHIQHVITVVMENRVYDNYFGTYCQSLGPYCSSTGNGLPPGLCVLMNPLTPTTGCVRPYNMTPAMFNTPDLQHDWVSGHNAWDNGAMDGFYQAEARGIQPFGHYNGTTIPIYWDMAEQYAMSDNLFGANLSYSLPNHWYLIGGQSPNISQSSYLRNTSDRATYLKEADNTSTVQDVLNHSKVSWKYYDYSLLSRAAATANPGSNSAYDYWNPMASRTESYSPTFNSHFVGRSSFLSDVGNGTLPNISWVIPTANASDHPGYNETVGQSWIAQLVDAVEDSAYWNSTAIFVVWDDYGGWYDHVAPPRVMTKLLSFRSPALLISPYAKENYISHDFLDFFSLLHYVEWQFGLGCVTALDCTAPPPFDLFNFNQTARLPIQFATDWKKATYPMALQPMGQPVLCDRCNRIVPELWTNSSVLTGNISMDT